MRLALSLATDEEGTAMEPSKRYPIMFRAVVICFVLAVLASCAITSEDEPALVIQSPPGTKTTVVLLRHGGRDPAVEGANPSLTWKGKKRAQALLAAIGDIGVTAIYCSNLKRNLQTAQPLAEHLGVKINMVSRSRLFNPEKLARELLEEFLTKQAGGVVVWIGNRRNVKEIYKLVDGTGSPPIEYGKLCIVTIPDIGAPRIKKLTYSD